MPGKRWTAEETALLDALYAEGKKDHEVAAILGRTEKSVQARKNRAWFEAQKRHVPADYSPFIVTHARAVQVLAQMIKHGCTYDAMAERLGGNADSVGSFISRNREQINAAIKGNKL